MTSTITLYYKSLVTKEKNFALDIISGYSAIETYLATLTKTTIQNFQYIKHRLSLSIKINMNQTNLEMVDSKDLNYVKIQNGTEKAYYYFIISKNWRGQDTIELVLSMDTLNTFSFNGGYIVDKKTLIKRQHKDRFEKIIRTADFPLEDDFTFPNDDLDKILVAEQIIFYETYLQDKIFENKKIEIYYDTEQLDYHLVIFDFTPEETKWILEKTTEYQEDWKMKFVYNEITYNVRIPISLFSANSSYIDLKNKRIIHLKSEDISCPVYKINENILNERKDDLAVAWSLYYKNRNTGENAPVDCFLIPDTPLTIKYKLDEYELNTTTLPDDKYCIFYYEYNGEMTFNYPNGSITLKPKVEETDWRTSLIAPGWYRKVIQRTLFAVHRSGTTIKSYIGKFTEVKHYFAGIYISTKYDGKWEEVGTGAVKILNPPDSLKTYARTSALNNVEDIMTKYYKKSYATTTILLGGFLDGLILDITAINKTLAENIKIINLPYSPTSYEIDASNNIKMAQCWEYQSGDKRMKLADLNYKFNNPITTYIPSILMDFIDNVVQVTSLNPKPLRTLKDPKLYHSDYHRNKFVYDSFSRIFPLEQIDYFASVDKLRNPYKIASASGSFDPKNIQYPFEFDFVMTRNIVSKFLFKFDFVYSHSTEDYPNLVAVSRNNEEVLYNSQYLNYIRTGYNYDLKSKERQEIYGTAGLGLSIAGLIASIGLTASGYGTPIGVAGIVGSLTGIVGSTLSLAKTTAQNEENIQRKLQETQQQAVSVLNADDYDLLYAYSNNKAKLCTYHVSANMEKVLDDLFYYGGYTINEQGIPNNYSRVWFNFVQASLVIKESSNLPTEIEDDIKEKFEQGVTFLHYHQNEFDFEQKYENFESNLVVGG